MRSLASTISYLELLKLAFPEVIVVISALVVLAIGLTSGQGAAVASVSSAKPSTKAAGTFAGAIDPLMGSHHSALMPCTRNRAAARSGRLPVFAMK